VSHLPPTVALVTDVPMLPQRDLVVLVTLQDGRQLEGTLIVRTNCFEIAGTVFGAWEIEEILGDVDYIQPSTPPAVGSG
jgi:hypothetical protein